MTKPNRKRPEPRAIITISMSMSDVLAVDEMAQAKGMTRAAFIREEALRGVRRERRKISGFRCAIAA